MNLTQVSNKVERTLTRNSPAILSALGVSGTITTAYLAGKASFKAVRVLDKEKEAYPIYDKYEMDTRTKVELVWKLYIPAGISAAVTIGCIVGATRVSVRRTAMVTAAYSLSERAFSEYREKVVQHIGEKKEQAVRDELVQDRINANPVTNKEVIVVGSGTVLCCEMHTGRYFLSDMETLRKTENNINAQLINQDDASLSDFYYGVGLPFTSASGQSGWTSDRMLELEFTTTLSDDNRPCLAFNYNYINPF
jgi:hypothetical protein